MCLLSLTKIQQLKKGRKTFLIPHVCEKRKIRRMILLESCRWMPYVSLASADTWELQLLVQNDFSALLPLHLGTWEVGFAPDGSPFTGWKRLPTLLCGNTFCGDYRWLTACPSGSGNFQAAGKELPHRGWADDSPSLLLTELVGPGWTWQASWTKEHTTAYMTHTVLNIHSVLT